MTFRIRSLADGFGAEVLDLDLARIDAASADMVMDAMVEHALLLFRRQSLDDGEIFRLSSAFGPVEEPAAKASHSPGYKDVNYISNLHDGEGRLIGGLTETDQGDGPWHSDQAFRRNPATISTLFCVHPPAEGGNTCFSSTTRGYAALPPTLVERAEGLRGRYLPSAQHQVETREVSHAAVLVNPSNGRRSLYVSPTTRGFEGLDDAESERLTAKLLGYQLREAHQYSHRWRMGDMLIYDNAQLLHRREAFRGLRWLKATRIFAPRERFAIPD